MSFTWRTKSFAIALILLSLGIWGSRRLHAQISPGPLSKAHQSLSGVTQCASCHKVGGGGALKCLDCHTEINRRLTAGLGFHATVVKKDNPHKDCARCHSEHNGENFQLVRWDPSQEKFDHGKAGYKLEGKHASIKCSQCHNSAFIQPEFKQVIKQKDLNRSFLGLSPACLSCHKDVHQGQFKKDCLSCHNTADWKDLTRFNHANTRYPLTGEHAKVTCAKCHKPVEPGHSAKYTGMNFASCAACHADPHKGAFKKDCASCHSTASWKQLSAAGVSSQFDHGKTKFPLLGKHATVDCAKCHRSGDFKAKVPFALCADCHKPDPHEGQFAKRKGGDKCESCHTVEGWKPAKFTVQDHASSGYPLEGAHIKVDCAKCHVPAGKATKFKIKFAQCTNCHQDAHASQFASPPLSNKCESCHTVKTFAPSSFTLARHKQTKFPLVEAHIAVACMECHAAKRKSEKSPVPYHFPDMTCQACHQDPHRGQFKEQMSKKRADGRVPGCAFCHSQGDWKDLTKFDHDQTAYPLAGAHKAVSCIQCHKPPNLEVTLRNASFKDAPRTCEGCHQDPHARQFVRKGTAPACDQCHRVAKWKPSLFDHEKTAFSLKGAHERVQCNACHKSIREIDGKPVLFYLPTPKECAACHGPRVSG